MSDIPTHIRVMIVDDHPLFRAGLQKALEFTDDLLIVGASVDGEQALIDAKNLKPDVILLDINLPRMNGLQVARQLHATNAKVPYVIILTAHHDDEQIIHAFGIGASAYCTKDVHPAELIDIIRDVMKGFYVANTLRMSRTELVVWIQNQKTAQKGTATSDDDEHFSPLSGREMEILAYVTDGLLNKEIAHELGISQQTVKNHITSILKKLNVKDRTQAAVTALKRGWVRLNNENQQEA